MSGNQTTQSSINRRELLSGLSALGAVGVAGCLGGDDGGGDGDHGERVPTLTIQHYTGDYIMENLAVVTSEQLDEKLGISTEVTALDIATAVGNVTNDNRFSMLPTYAISTTPDGTYSMERMGIDEAGAAGTNNSNWPNCAYSVLMDVQNRVPDPEDRKDVLDAAQHVLSNDIPTITGAPINNDYGYRPNSFNYDEDLVGEQAFARTNPELWSSIEATGDDSVVFADTGTYFYDATNFLTAPSQSGPWNNLVHSKLLYWGPDYEGMNNDLAESVEVSDDALEYTVTLRDDATFHNGDPVTAEDVKFTFEWLTDNAGTFLDAPRIDLTVDAVDDTTAVFNLENPYAPLVSRDFHNWGILHRETWVDAGALDDAAGAQPGADMVGSGPFELTQFSSGQGATLEPYEDHHLFDPQATLNFSVYRDGNTAFQALNGGDVDIFTVNPPQLDQLVEGGSDEVDAIRGSGLLTYILMPQCSASPTKFHEFRDGIATALDYQEIMAVAWAGLAEPQMYAHFLDQAHPIFTDDTDSLYEQGNGDPTGDVEAAKQILEDEGWTWDSDGNLRYPQDADLTALWPAEESPDPENYPCLNEDRQVVQSDEVELPIELPETV